MNKYQKTIGVALGLVGTMFAVVSGFNTREVKAASGKESATAAWPPSPAEYVRNLDVECYRPSNLTPPINQIVGLNHLNPVLREMGVPDQKARVSYLEEVCVPVAKNGFIPPDNPLRLIQYTDLACYRADPLEETKVYKLRLSQLNPVLERLEDQEIKVGQLRQLCTPVEKRGAEVPDEVLRFIQHLDVACYEVRGEAMEVGLKLSHLNPLLRRMETHSAAVERPTRLCVPVAKNERIPPKEVLKLLRWVDLLKYRISLTSEVQVFGLRLRHLNPLFEDYRPFDVRLGGPTTLAVPVAKNGYFPPKE